MLMAKCYGNYFFKCNSLTRESLRLTRECLRLSSMQLPNEIPSWRRLEVRIRTPAKRLARLGTAAGMADMATGTNPQKESGP